MEFLICKSLRSAGIFLLLCLFCLRQLWSGSLRLLQPQIICQSPNPQGDGIGRWGIWKVTGTWVWNSHGGISTLSKGPTEVSSCFQHSEDTVTWQRSVTQEVDPHQSWNLLAPSFCIFPTSRKITCVVSKPLSLCHFCYSNLQGLAQITNSGSLPPWLSSCWILPSLLSSSFSLRVSLLFSFPLSLFFSFLFSLLPPSLCFSSSLFIIYLKKTLKLRACGSGETRIRSATPFNPKCRCSSVCPSLLSLSLLFPFTLSFLLFFILGGYTSQILHIMVNSSCIAIYYIPI